MQLVARFKTLAQQETPAQRRERMVPGIIYGLIIAASYTLVSGTINKLSFPDIPIGIDWQTLLITGFFFSLWLGVGGGFVNWFTQTEEGLIPCLLLMIVTALGAGALTFEGSLPTQFGKFILLALPVIGVSVMMTILLRALGVRHAQMLEKGKSLFSWSILALPVIALVIGGWTAFSLVRWDGNIASEIRFVHHNLQAAAANPAQVGELFPLKDLPELPSHLNVPYTLLERNSRQIFTNIDVTANFKDGYQFTCMVTMIIPSYTPALVVCAEGNQIPLPAR